MLDEFHTAMAKWVDEGKIKWEETVLEGIENAPKLSLAFSKEKILAKCL